MQGTTNEKLTDEPYNTKNGKEWLDKRRFALDNCLTSSFTFVRESGDGVTIIVEEMISVMTSL